MPPQPLQPHGILPSTPRHLTFHAPDPPDSPPVEYLNHHSKIALAFFKYSKSYDPSSSMLLDTAAYNILIDILCKVRQFDVAWQLILQMDSQSLKNTDSKPDFTTFFVLIRRLISAGLTRTAVRAFYDMRTWRRLKKKIEEESVTFGSEFEEYHLKPYKR